MATRRTMYVPELAEQLGISRNAAYEAVKRGEIPSIRIGRKYLIPGDTVDRLLAEAKASSAGRAPPATADAGKAPE